MGKFILYSLCVQVLIIDVFTFINYPQRKIFAAELNHTELLKKFLYSSTNHFHKAGDLKVSNSNGYTLKQIGPIASLYEIHLPDQHPANIFLENEISSQPLFDTMYISTDLLFQTLKKGFIGNDTIVLVATSNDVNNIARHRITGKLFSKDKYFSFSITDSLLLNYERWYVSPKNNIRYVPGGVVVTDFILTKDSAGISAVSQQNTAGSPIVVSFQNFDLRNIFTAFSKDTSLANGIVNGEMLMSDFDKKLPALTGNLDVVDMIVKRHPIGRLQITSVKQNDSAIRASISVIGNENDLNAMATFNLNDSSQQFDAMMDIKKLPFLLVQKFAKGFMNQASGNLSGQIELKGRFDQPRWKGKINIDTAKFGITQFGNNYTISNQRVNIDYPDICFSQFTIRDSLNNPLIVNGKVEQYADTGYNLFLGINTRDFNLVNAPKAINNQAFGTAIIDANVSVRGNSKAPHMKGGIYLDHNSDITMVLPEKSIDKDAARSLVRFIDRDTFSFTREAHNKAQVMPVNAAPIINPDLDIEVDKDASLTIVIDPSAGDELKLQGVANLKAGVDSSNNIVLAGLYKLSSGYYELNYEFAKKRFNLLDGGTLQFKGDAADAQINIKAGYIANTSPNDLLWNEVGTVDPRFARSFQQKIPFLIILYLKGSLMKPLIRFDIQLAESEQINPSLRTTIEHKLLQLRTDTAATNKQVFALLALDRFVGEQSTDFFKGNGGGFNDMASESVSRFLSDALDQIASDLFKGINIDLNLKSYKDFADNNDEQKADDLGVGVSKDFLNDRLNITVGKNFGIEGQDGSAKASKQKGSRFLPDVTTLYKLSKDGKYMLKGYSKNQLEVILDGYVVETGVGFIVTMDYDKFNELFIGKKKTDL